MKRSGERSIPFPFGGVHGKVEPSNCEANPFGCTIFFVKEGAYFRRIDFKFIRWIKAEGSYCKLFMDNARELLLSFNLTEITSYLPVQDFVRVHRSYIVNINSVDSFIGNMLFIGNCRIPISKSHKNEVLERLNLIGEV